MIRQSLVAVLVVLLPASPAAAGGTKIVVGGTLPAHTPFVSATTPLPAHRPFGAAFAPGAAVVPDPDVPPRPRPRWPVLVTAPVVASQPVIIVNQPVYIVAAPRTCQSLGAWSYQWVPYTTTQTAWVQGSWAPDGQWIDSHWELQPYTSGYYQPYWVPDQTYSC
jgi:hypothetical protein